MKYILFLFIASSLFFTACSDDFFSQTIEVDPPEYEKRIAAHAFSTLGDSTISVMLSRNFGIFDDPKPQDYYIPGAVIEILENGQSKLVVTSPTANNAPNLKVLIPITPDFFAAGNTYELKVTHPDYPMANATQIMPDRTIVDSVSLRQNGTITPDGDRISAIDAYIKDPVGVKNYYAITVAAESLSGGTNTIYPASPDDPNASIGAYNSIVVSDEFFDGKSYRLTYPFYDYNAGGNDVTFTVSIRSVTEDFYVYLLSTQRKSDAEDFGIFVEPVTLHSNMKGGIGLFGLSQVQKFTIER